MGHTSRIAAGHIGRAIAAADSAGLDRSMTGRGMGRFGRSLRSLILPLVLFVVFEQVAEIVLMGYF